MDELLTKNRLRKLLRVHPKRIDRLVQSGRLKPVDLPNVDPHRKPQQLFRASDVEAALMAGSDAAVRRGTFIAAVLYQPHDGGPAQVVATLADQGVVAELMRGVVTLHAEGRAQVAPIAPELTLEALDREREALCEPLESKPEASGPSRLAARERDE
jgi:hypothetical protein